MQALRISRHLVFTGIAAHGIDLGDARHPPQHRTNYPILYQAAFCELIDVEGFFAIGRVFQGVLIDFAQAGRNRTQYWRHTRWHAAHDLDQTFEYDLSCTIDIRLVGEDQRNHRNAIAIQGAHFGEAGKPRHGDFDRYRHKALDFFGGSARHFGGDLYLDVSDVRKCIDGQSIDRK